MALEVGVLGFDTIKEGRRLKSEANGEVTAHAIPLESTGAPESPGSHSLPLIFNQEILILYFFHNL